MTTFSYSTDAPAKVRAGVLVLPMYSETEGPARRPRREGGRPGAGVSRRQAHRQEAARTCWSSGATATGSPPARSCSSASATKAELTPTALRRVLGRVAGTLGRFGTAATTFPQAVGRPGRRRGASRRPSRARCSARYRFDRYKATKAEAKALTRVTVLGSARAGREGGARRGQARAGRRPRPFAGPATW